MASATNAPQGIEYDGYKQFESNSQRLNYLREVADSVHDFQMTGRCPTFSEVGSNLLNPEKTHFKIEENNQFAIDNSKESKRITGLLHEIYDGKNNNIENKTMEIYESLIPEVSDETVLDKDDFKGAIDALRSEDSTSIAIIVDCKMKDRFMKDTFDFVERGKDGKCSNKVNSNIFNLNLICSHWDEAPKTKMSSYHVDIIPTTSTNIKIFGTNMEFYLKSLNEYNGQLSQDGVLNLSQLSINNLVVNFNDSASSSQSQPLLIPKVILPKATFNPELKILDMSVKNMCDVLSNPPSNDDNLYQQYFNENPFKKIKMDNETDDIKDLTSKIKSMFKNERIQKNKLFYNLKRSMDAGMVEIANYLNDDKQEKHLFLHTAYDENRKPCLMHGESHKLLTVEGLKNILLNVDQDDQSESYPYLEKSKVDLPFMNGGTKEENENENPNKDKLLPLSQDCKFVIFTCDRLCYLKAKIMETPAIYISNKLKVYKGKENPEQLYENIKTKYGKYFVDNFDSWNNTREALLIQLQSITNTPNATIATNITNIVTCVLHTIRQQIVKIQDNNSKEEIEKKIDKLGGLIQESLTHLINYLIKHFEQFDDIQKFFPSPPDNSMNQYNYVKELFKIEDPTNTDNLDQLFKMIPILKKIDKYYTCLENYNTDNINKIITKHQEAEATLFKKKFPQKSYKKYEILIFQLLQQKKPDQPFLSQDNFIPDLIKDVQTNVVQENVALLVHLCDSLDIDVLSEHILNPIENIFNESISFKDYYTSDNVKCLKIGDFSQYIQCNKNNDEIIGYEMFDEIKKYKTGGNGRSNLKNAEIHNLMMNGFINIIDVVKQKMIKAFDGHEILSVQLEEPQGQQGGYIHESKTQKIDDIKNIPKCPLSIYGNMEALKLTKEFDNFLIISERILGISFQELDQSCTKKTNQIYKKYIETLNKPFLWIKENFIPLFKKIYKRWDASHVFLHYPENIDQRYTESNKCDTEDCYLTLKCANLLKTWYTKKHIDEIFLNENDEILSDIFLDIVNQNIFLKAFLAAKIHSILNKYLTFMVPRMKKNASIATDPTKGRSETETDPTSGGKSISLQSITKKYYKPYHEFYHK